jgi:hypothetical protein
VNFACVGFKHKIEFALIKTGCTIPFHLRSVLSSSTTSTDMRFTVSTAVFLKLSSAGSFGRKSIAERCIRHQTNEKCTHTSLLKLPLFVDIQQGVGELVLFITSSFSNYFRKIL